MPRRYFVLVERVSVSSPWGVQFGDYDRATVEAEREDMRDHGAEARNLKVLKTGTRQADIDAAVAKLNGEARS